MDDKFFKSIEKVIPKTYLQQASDVRKVYSSQLLHLIEQKKCPETGWDDATIQLTLMQLAMMDSNNFPHNAGVGEREARIYSKLVSTRHYNLSHGIGRSGDIAEVQPKATGSSIIYQITNSLALDVIKAVGVPSTAACLVVPVATGMAVVITLLALRQQRPNAKYVLWPRIDQKSCFKAITTAGLTPVIIENEREGDELRTNVKQVEEEMKRLGADNVLAVLTTTSCFAPRGIDKLEEVAELCQTSCVPHVINNAYGVQSSKCMHHIQQAQRMGRVDAFIQSTDKNFMVPVGGSIIAGFNSQFIKKIGKTYPGRASGSPILDLFITLLSMGVSGYKDLVKERRETKKYLEDKMREVAERHKLKILNTRNNPISVAMTLPSRDNSITKLGSMLFLRGVSGTRVITTLDEKEIVGTTFKGWGSHSNNYDEAYLTAAAGIGMKNKDVDLFITRLEKCLIKITESKMHQSSEENSVPS